MTWASPVAALLLLLAGALLLALLRPERARGPLEWLATATALGLVAVPALVVAVVGAAGPLGVGAGRAGLGLLAAGGLAALVLARPARPTHPERALRSAAERGAGPWTRLAAVATWGFALVAVFQAATTPVHVFDPIFHFAHKGKLIFHEGIATAAWTDVQGELGRVMTHTRYPPGIPALQAAVGYVEGRFDEDAARALMALFALAPAGWLFACLRPRGAAAAAAGALLWLSLPMISYYRLPHDALVPAATGLLLGVDRAEQLTGLAGELVRPDGWALDGAGDLPLAALLLGAVVHLARLLPGAELERDRADPWIAGVFLGGGALAKNEGLALAAVALAGFALCSLVRSGGRARGARSRWATDLARAAATALAVLAPWLLLRRRIPTVDEDYLSRLRPGTVLASLGRSGTVLRGFWENWSSPLQWGLLWPLLAVALVWSLRRGRRALAGGGFYPALVVLGGTALYALVLLVTPWELENLYRAAIPDRLLLHLAPVAVWATVALLWERREGEGEGLSPPP